MVKVIWSIPAKTDLRDIFHYIAKDSNYYARRVTQNIISRSACLSSFPNMGRVVPEIEDEAVRELIVYSYRLIYEISAKGIEVLAILHSKQNFSSDRF